MTAAVRPQKDEMMTNEKPVESRFQEYVAFAKKHRLAAAFILIWLVAPTIWSVVVTIKGWNVSELEARIRSQNEEIDKKNGQRDALLKFN